MADLTLETFESQIASACDKSPLVVSLTIIASGVTWTHQRIFLKDETFVDAFYNEATGKTSFALIKNSQRIFGADNTGEWHWHPFDSPDSHLSSSEAITIAEFLSEIEKRTPASTTTSSE
ncbi:MAG: hypothetical protein HY740_09485 [Chloroflexi bacterium]|nr:hypothetical protein [Chloroflexota bacterium]